MAISLGVPNSPEVDMEAMKILMLGALFNGALLLVAAGLILFVRVLAG
jgi:hypothetical protein